MNIMHRFAHQKTWMKGGMLGAGICALLFGFYLFIYFPALYLAVHADPTAEEPSWEFVLPTATGHILPLMSHFIVEGSTIPTTVCKETETHCLAWSLSYEDGSVPWTDPQGGDGYCLMQETSPESSCVDRVQGTISLLTLIALEAVYFAVGAIVATIIEKRKKRSAI